MKKLGIITPYSKQVFAIRDRIKTLEDALTCPVEVNTVDGFQGREKDIIVFSTVRSQRKDDVGKKKTIGFLRDRRRMNVSLSRAKYSLIVVGDTDRLRISKKWRSLVDYAKSLNRCFKVQPPFENFMEASNKVLDKFIMQIV
eukprot:TRINITY_DN8156_c0_g1_i4.p1 TRINITY_DN8156_c0_g1~~TRINITY_DN8156_c0_g1_i4.p1  ORF type:complete len:142 (+),score=16.01 TRINITY_DN8156_c0_g1_i4:327-752(+)